MANGFCPSLLSHISAVIGMNDKNKQIFPAGFLRKLLETYDSTSVLNAPYEGGHVRPLSLSYKRRPTSSAVRDAAPDCDFFNIPTKQEFEVPSLDTKSTGFFMNDDLIRQYCKDASEYIKLDKQANTYILERETHVMREVYDSMLDYVNILLTEVNKSLVTDMATKFGNNVLTGNANAVAYDFDIRSTAINDGIIKLFSDLRENEICDSVHIVGNGDFMNLEMIMEIFNNSTDQGINRADFMRMLPQMYYDKHTKSIWGDGEIGVFARDSVQLISQPKYQMGFERRLGNSTFFAVPFPASAMQCAQGNEDKMMIDVQIKEFDCATELSNGYGEQTTIGPGVQMSLSYNYKLFVTPDIFDAADPLAGTNGTLRYKMTGRDCSKICPEEEAG